MHTVSFRLFELIKDLEKMKGQNYSLSMISDKTGITRAALSRMMNHKTDRVYLSTIGTLLAFFRDEGLGVELSDMFNIEIGADTKE